MADARLALDAPFSDGAVLQRGLPVTVHGRAAPRASVSVTFAGTTKPVRADAAGAWQAVFAPQRAATGASIVARSGTQMAQANGIAIGDVFLCSGQSNMEFTMSEATLRPEDRQRGIDGALHLLSIAHDQARIPRTTFAQPPTWQSASIARSEFSAVCLLAGRELALKSNVQVGLIDSSWGATAIESWLPPAALVAAGAPADEIRTIEAFRSDPVTAEARYGAALDTRWKRPAEKGGRIGYANLYGAMIAPLKDFGLAGALWYQGEANAGRGDSVAAYRAKLAAMLQTWRQQFRRDLPFVIIQLANFGPLSNKPDDNAWARVREAQRQVAAADPRAALVVTIDVGERLFIHPPLKLPVAQRSARALAKLTWSDPLDLGPEVRSARQAGSFVNIAVAGGTGSLMAASWGRPGPFALCSEAAGNNTCAFADAEFADGGIRVAVPAGMTPDRVRYCYAGAPICNIFDGAGMPLGPFDLAVR
ncbi:sialate O-acetylesterase [Parablastomonas sp. CN1-191]|uniref:sialate O-acetylesterase n=1 Tax=Parablastomonas sp. CN1-191 TaxID=3400908 RepID=UPI003BF90F1F